MSVFGLLSATQHIMTDLGKLLSSSACLWLQRAHMHVLRGPLQPLPFAAEILSAVCTSHTFCSSRAGGFRRWGVDVRAFVCMCFCERGGGGVQEEAPAGGWFTLDALVHT